MSAGIPFALMTASSEGGAQSSTAPHAEAVPENKPPLFPDNVQFWYETWRAFGAASYGASEVHVTASRIQSGKNRISEEICNEQAHN